MQFSLNRTINLHLISELVSSAKFLVVATKDLERLYKMFESFMNLLRWQISAIDLNSIYELHNSLNNVLIFFTIYNH